MEVVPVAPPSQLERCNLSMDASITEPRNCASQKHMKGQADVWKKGIRPLQVSRSVLLCPNVLDVWGSKRKAATSFKSPPPAHFPIHPPIFSTPGLLANCQQSFPARDASKRNPQNRGFHDTDMKSLRKHVAFTTTKSSHWRKNWSAISSVGP